MRGFFSIGFLCFLRGFLVLQKETVREEGERWDKERERMLM